MMFGEKVHYLLDLLTKGELYQKVLIGLIGGGILKLLAITYEYMSRLLFSFSHFTISGIWIAEFDSYHPGKHNIELLRIVQKNEMVSFFLEQYSNYSKTVRRFQGKGIFRSGEFSAIYYPLDKTMVQNGVLALRTLNNPKDAQTMLIGEFAEFAGEKENYGITIGKGTYCLKRIKLPIIKRIRLLLRRQCFKNYESLRRYIEQTSA